MSVNDDARPHLTRNQRRQIKRLQAAIDKAVASDRLFFERFPHREHRVRYAHSAEVEMEAIANGEPIVLKPGMRALSAVKNLCCGVRLRLLLLSWADAETDVDEATAREIYELYQDDRTRAVEREMRAISCGEDAA